jgi:hypothetical protein
MSNPVTAAFTPLFPEERVLGPSIEKAAALMADGYRLGGQASPQLRDALAGLLRAMNSCFTNRIEGQQTLPSYIERASHRAFDADQALARRQRLALAHMEAEQSLETDWSTVAPRDLFRADRVVVGGRLTWNSTAVHQKRTVRRTTAWPSCPANAGRNRSWSVARSHHPRGTVRS